MLELVVAFLMTILLAMVTDKFASPPKYNELKPGKFGYFIAWGCLFFGFLPLYIMALGVVSNDTWFALFIMTPVGIWAFLYIMTLKYVFDSNGIEYTTKVSFGDAGNWKHFREARYSPQANSLVLEFAFGDILIPNYLKGRTNLERFMRAKGYLGN